MARYRKKPVVIEAWRYDGSSDSVNAIIANSRGKVWTGIDGLYIQTLEGVLHASPGDWLIRGVQNEVYPVKPDIFAATYEPADDLPVE